MAFRQRAFLVVLLTLLFGLPAVAQEISLTAPDGAFEMRGVLLGYDGRFYRLETEHGEVSVDGHSVICAGTTCPDPENFIPDLRIAGEAALTDRLLPALLRAFARSSGWDLKVTESEDATKLLTLHDAGEPVLRVTVASGTAREGFADVLADQADLLLSLREIRPEERRLIRNAGYGDLTALHRSRVLALDALVPVVAPDNPVRRIGMGDLLGVLAGEITDWSQLGGSPGPIALHLPEAQHGLGQVIADRLLAVAGMDLTETATQHAEPAGLVQAVGQDRRALGITSFLETGNTAALELTGPCGFTIGATRREVKAEDYPLTVPLILYQPARRLPQIARDFLTFLRSGAAQLVIRRLGYVDQRPETIGVALQGRRFHNAINAAGPETSLEELQRMTGTLGTLKRLTTSFRFEPGSTRLDAQSRSNVRQLGHALQSGAYDSRRVVFVGFSDGEGAARANREISLKRAEIVRNAVLDVAPLEDLRAVTLDIDAFGEALPMACDDSPWGRQTNRRVETWID